MTTSHEPLSAHTPGSIQAPDQLGEPPKASKRLILGLVLGNFGLWIAFFSPVVVSFPVKVAQLAPGGREVALSIALGVSAIFGIVANPIAGRLSDRSLSRFGRRRPWILGATIFGVIGEIMAGAAPSMAVFTIGAVIGAIGFAAGLSVLLSVIPEHIPPRQQGGVAGLLGVSQAVASVIGIVAGGALLPNVVVAFTAPGIVGIIAVGVLCLTLKERPITAADRPAFGARQFWGSFWTSPRKHPDFGWAWFSRFAIFMAFAAVVNYQVYFLNARLGIPTEQTTQLVGAGTVIETVALVIMSIVAGRVSDRLHRRKPFVFVASAIGALGLIVMAFTTAVPGFLLALALIGLAQGVYYSIDIAMIAELLPNTKQDAGKDFGVFSIASQLPQTLSPVIAPLFLAIGAGAALAGHGNYTALYIGSAVFAVIAAFTALPIRGVR